jgi:hypothetical protein
MMSKWEVGVLMFTDSYAVVVKFSDGQVACDLHGQCMPVIWCSVPVGSPGSSTLRIIDKCHVHGCIDSYNTIVTAFHAWCECYWQTMPLYTYFEKVFDLDEHWTM